MKPRTLSASRSFFSTVMTLAGLALIASPAAHAIVYYWDNITGAGFGTAGGTWADPTVNKWNTNNTGAGAGAASITTTTADNVNFGTGTNGLLGGTIAISGTVQAGNITFGTASGNIILSGGTAINLAATSTISNGSNTNTISTPLSGATNLTITGGGTLKFSGGSAGFGSGGTASVVGGTTVQFVTGGANGLGGSTGFTINLGNATSGGTLSVNNGGVNNANAITVIAGTGTRNLTAGGTISANFTGVITANENLSVNFVSSSSGGILAVSGATNTIASTKTVTFNNSGAANTFTDSALWGGAGKISYIGDDASNTLISGQKTYQGGATIGTWSGTGAAVIGASSTFSGATLVSGAFGTGTLTLNGGRTRASATGDSTVGNAVTFAGDMTFVNGGANENSLIFTGATALGSAIRTLTVDTGSTGTTKFIEFGGAISGTGGIIKAGAGNLTLSGANTYSGVTTVSAGTLTLSDSLALQNSALDTTNSIAGTATAGLKTTVTALTFGGLTGDKDLSNVFTTTSGGYSGITTFTLKHGTGSSAYSGAIAEGAVNMNLTKTGAGTQTLSGANSYTGLTTVNQGTLTLENDQSAATGGFNVGSTTTNANPILNIGTGTTTTTVAVGSANGFQIGTSGTTGIDAAVNVVNLATVTNDGTLTIGRRGVLNIESGATWNQSGELTVQGWGNVVSSGQGRAILTVGSGGLFNYTGANTIKLPVAGGGGNYSGANPGIVIQGDFFTGMGFESDQTQSGTSSTTNGLTIDGGTLKFTASVGDIATATGSGSAFPILVTLTNAAKIDTQANSVGSSSNIGGTGSLTKLGAGTLTFSGANDYSGTTSLSAGTLKINGDQSAANGDVTVAAGATLAGSGTIGGATSFAGDPAGGGIHSAGDGVGKQSFTSTVSYGAGSIFAWELGTTPEETNITKDGSGFVTASNRGTAYDAVNVAGALSGADAVFRVVLSDNQTFADTFWNTDHQWTDIFRSADHINGQPETASTDIASIFGGGFQYYNSTGAIGNTSNSRSFSVTGSTLTWSAVPEPSSALAGLLLGAGLLRRRRAA